MDHYLVNLERPYVVLWTDNRELDCNLEGELVAHCGRQEVVDV